MNFICDDGNFFVPYTCFGSKFADILRMLSPSAESFPISFSVQNLKRYSDYFTGNQTFRTVSELYECLKIADYFGTELTDVRIETFDDIDYNMVLDMFYPYEDYEEICQNIFTQLIQYCTVKCRSISVEFLFKHIPALRDFYFDLFVRNRSIPHEYYRAIAIYKNNKPPVYINRCNMDSCECVVLEKWMKMKGEFGVYATSKFACKEDRKNHIVRYDEYHYVMINNQKVKCTFKASIPCTSFYCYFIDYIQERNFILVQNFHIHSWYNTTAPVHPYD